jgi:transcriptional/translational regulatory protein YebC/TACO1
MKEFLEPSPDTVESFEAILKTKALPFKINFAYVVDDKQKKLCTISKIPDNLSFLFKKDLLVTFNEKLMNLVESDDMVNILIEAEIERIEITEDKLKLVKPTFTTFPSILNKHGLEAVLRAMQVEGVAIQQSEEKQAELSQS